jgi:hypothetical protein
MEGPVSRKEENAGVFASSSPILSFPPGPGCDPSVTQLVDVPLGREIGRGQLIPVFCQSRLVWVGQFLFLLAQKANLVTSFFCSDEDTHVTVHFCDS